MLQSTQSRSSRLIPAFTLVELLVVISIIALLLAILLPSLQAARRRAMNVVCFSSKKQMWLSYNMYTMDFRDYYYPAQYSLGNIAQTSFPDNKSATWWGTGLQRELIHAGYSQGTLEYNGTTDYSKVASYISGGRCPTASDDFVYKKSLFSLGYNSSLGLGYPAFTPAANGSNPDPYKTTPYTTSMPGALPNAGMSHLIRNYLNGVTTGITGERPQRRVGLFREQDLYNTARVGVFFDSLHSNRAPRAGSGFFGANSASELLHPGMKTLNIIFIDGHAASLTESEWFNGTINNYF